MWTYARVINTRKNFLLLESAISRERMRPTKITVEPTTFQNTWLFPRKNRENFSNRENATSWNRWKEAFTLWPALPAFLVASHGCLTFRCHQTRINIHIEQYFPNFSSGFFYSSVPCLGATENDFTLLKFM